MKRFVRFVSLLTLAAFLGLSTLETYHSHKTVKQETNCAICKIAHQTPLLTDPAQQLSPGVAVSSVQSDAVAHPYLQFVFVSHGLSPPAL